MAVEEKYSDQELIAALGRKENSNQAILFIYKEFHSTISSFIIAKGGSQQDGEDVFQETVVTFMEVLKKNKFRGEASIKTFLVSIARNIWFNQIKKNERSTNREKIFENSRDQQELDISHELGDLETKRELRKLLLKLDEPCRKILALFYFEDLTMKEILLYLPYENEQVVRNKKYKCLQQLTGMIKQNPLIAGQISNKNK
jgi:RNA polymerase sigma factor (sigma-70 family)